MRSAFATLNFFKNSDLGSEPNLVRFNNRVIDPISVAHFLRICVSIITEKTMS